MVSKAIASLDAWLARAEEVLAEQREHAISPSLAALWDHGQEETVMTLATLSRGLSDLLEALCSRPGRWILIVEDEGRRHLFWQALAFEDGSLVTEVVSNNYLDGDDRWTAAQEVRFSELGWEPPVADRRPNWISVEYSTAPNIGHVVERALATLRELFGLGDEDGVLVKMFSSPDRGDTPAGPEYPTQDAAALTIPDRSMREARIPDTIDRYPQTPEITGRIIAYREGKITWAVLFKELTERDYADPSHYGQHINHNTIEAADHFAPGTTGELHQAGAIGLLDPTEYEAILSGALRAHGA